MMYLEIDKKKKNQLAVVQDNGEEFTYGELVAFCSEWREWIPEREFIFILCENTMGAIAGHIACIENHIVPLMVSAKMDIELLNDLINRYQPNYYWVPRVCECMVKRGTIIAEKYDYVLVREKNSKEIEMYQELAMLLTTSGSTGSPKLVRHSYHNLYANAKNVAVVFRYNMNDRSLIDLKLHYTMGLNVACSSLYAGASILLTEYNPMQKEYWNFFDSNKVTNITGVPYSYEILKKLKFFKKEYPDLRILAQGGGKLTEAMFSEIAQYAQKNNKLFYATFGTSETTARLAFLPPQMAMIKIGSIGKAIPNGKLCIVDDEYNEICGEGIGELVYEGPNVTLGYALEREDLQKGDERKGVYYTGDIAKRDQDGFYYIKGRKSRFLKLYGYRVGLDESERLIKGNFDTECACVGNDMAMKIYITNKACMEEVRKYIAEKTKIPKSAFQIYYISNLPKNEVGKVMYSKLNEKES